MKHIREIATAAWRSRNVVKPTDTFLDRCERECEKPHVARRGSIGVIDRLAACIHVEEMRLKREHAVRSYFAWPVVWGRAA